MVPVRSGVHIMGADLMKVHPMGANGPISGIEDHILPSAQGDARRPRLVGACHDGGARRGGRARRGLTFGDGSGLSGAVVTRRPHAAAARPSANWSKALSASAAYISAGPPPM